MFLLAILIGLGSIAISSCSEADISSKPTESNQKSLFETGRDTFFNGGNLAAYSILLEALRQAQDRKETDTISQCHYYLGASSIYLGDYDGALNHLNQFLSYPKPIVEDEQRGSAYGRIATIYEKKGEYEQSFNYHLKALDIATKIGKIDKIARANYQLGSLFFAQEDYEKALEYYKKAEEISAPLDDKRIQFTCLAAIGSTYERMNEPDTSLVYNTQSMQIALEGGSKSSLVYAYQNIGSNYLQLGRIEEAKVSLLKSLEISDSLKTPWAKMGVLRDLGKLYIQTKEYDTAIKHLQEGAILAQEAKSKPKQVEFYENLALAYETKGEPDPALAYLKKRITLKDEILNEARIDAIQTQQTLREVKEQENKISLLEKDNEINKLTIWLSLGILSFIFMMLIVYIRKNKQEKRLNQQLEAYNHQIEDQNKQLAEINQELKQFTSVASHDLKSPLRTVASFSNLLQRRYKDQLDEAAQEYLDFIQSGVKRMISMLDDLLSYAKVGKKDIPLKWIDSSEILDEALFNLQENIRVEGAEVNIDKTSLPKIKANRTLMVQLFQNLIANAIKFRSSKAPIVTVNCSPNGKTHTFMVKDNGIGIDPEFKDKIFEMFGRINGKTEYEGTGIGLATCKKIVNNHGGEIWVESENGKGSTFYFSIPKEKEPILEKA
jgi:signal transduction histidine kinase